jgi:hypothetical protein
MLPGIFEGTILTRRVDLPPSLFLRPMHPKSEISPTAESIRKVLDAGWVGQLKIHGHRAQLHIAADPNEPILAYNRQGQPHQKALSPLMQSELRRLFTPSHGWNVIDAEWIKDDEKLFVFDFLKRNDESLHRLRFLERWEFLPRAYISPVVQTLGVFHTLDQCLEVLGRADEKLEGLVFKSSSPGFEDTSIVRCRRRASN